MHCAFNTYTSLSQRTSIDAVFFGESIGVRIFEIRQLGRHLGAKNRNIVTLWEMVFARWKVPYGNFEREWHYGKMLRSICGVINLENPKFVGKLSVFWSFRNF